MPFDTPSLPTLIARASADIESSQALRRSDAAVMARVHSGAIYGLYQFLEWQFRQMFPDTADPENLVRHGVGRGVPRKEATFANGMVTVTGTPGSVIPAATQLTANGIVYAAVTGVTLASSTATLEVRAVLAGGQGNQIDGVELDFVSPVVGVQSTAVVEAAGLTGGTDLEDIDVYRARVLERFRWVPHGGNETDYVMWAKAQPGVTRAWCKRQWVGPGTVGVFVVNDDASPITLSPAELSIVAAGIEAYRPVTAELHVLTPVLVAVNYSVTVTPDTPAVRAAVESALQNLHSRESDLGVRLLRTHIAEAISGAVGEIDHALISPTSDVIPASGQLLVYGGVTWV